MPARATPRPPAFPTAPAPADEPWDDDDLLPEDDEGSPLSGQTAGTRTASAEAGQPGHHTVTLGPDAAGGRLDKALATAMPSLSRSRLKALIDEGHVRMDGRTLADPSARVKPGQIIDLDIPEPEPALPEPENIPLTIVHEDDDVLVVDKPAGLVVHPAAGNPSGTLVNALLFHCGDRLSGIGGVRRPGIVHRLDKDTSGLMVVAKNDRAHATLSGQFADRTLSRTYQAVVWGVPRPAEGEIIGNIGRSRTDRKRMAVLERGGKTAITRYGVIERFGDVAALIECKLLTGRTHQIRVHMAYIGHPLVGDPVYGRGGRRQARCLPVPEPLRIPLVGFERQALHAIALEFRHPASGEVVGFTAAPPSDLRQLIACLEGI